MHYPQFRHLMRPQITCFTTLVIIVTDFHLFCRHHNKLVILPASRNSSANQHGKQQNSVKPISCRSPFTLARSGEGTFGKKRTVPRLIACAHIFKLLTSVLPSLSKLRRCEAVNNTATSPWLQYTAASTNCLLIFQTVPAYCEIYTKHKLSEDRSAPVLAEQQAKTEECG